MVFYSNSVNQIFIRFGPTLTYSIVVKEDKELAIRENLRYRHC